MIDSILPLLLLLLLVVALLAATLWWLVKQVLAKRRSQSLDKVTLHVRLPKEDETKIDAAEQLFGSLHSLRDDTGWGPLSTSDTLSLEIVAAHESIQFYVSVHKDHVDFVEKQIHSAYPSADILVVPEPDVFSLGGKIAYTALRFTGKNFLPIKQYKDLPTDSLNAITSAMSKMAEKEAVAVQIVLAPASNAWRHQARSFFERLGK